LLSSPAAKARQQVWQCLLVVHRGINRFASISKRLVFLRPCFILLHGGRGTEVAVIGDPFPNYFALFLLVFVVVVLFYGIIAIHDIPAKIAESRDHPHQDAIHAAGWVSLFTLHALWPFLWIWAMAYRPERGWGISHPSVGVDPTPPTTGSSGLKDLRRRVAELEKNQKSGAE
jgi:hypothetical protein